MIPKKILILMEFSKQRRYVLKKYVFGNQIWPQNYFVITSMLEKRFNPIEDYVNKIE